MSFNPSDRNRVRIFGLVAGGSVGIHEVLDVEPESSKIKARLMFGGTSITFDGKRVSLKWHRLRRRMSDPLFDGNNLREGMRLGASMELDFRVTRDFDFAVLHDAILEGETNGNGLVAERAREELGSVYYDDGDLHVDATGARRVLLLDDLTALQDDAHPQAVLQVDMKDKLDVVGQDGVRRLQQAFSGRKLPLIISGDCGDLIVALRYALPDVRRGIDPTDRLIEFFRKADTKMAVQQLRSEICGPARPDFVYLSWQLLLHARDAGVDLAAVCHDEGKKVDAWTYTLSDPESGFNDQEWREFVGLLSLRVDQITTDEAIETDRAYAARIRSG